jgi:hypothetical protein
MEMNQIAVDCQNPVDSFNIRATRIIVQCIIEKDSLEYIEIIDRAAALARQVNPGAANESDFRRDNARLISDAIGGVIAEYGWIKYLNTVFGEIAQSTVFSTATYQIDIKLNKGELLEVRSSFPRNGVKFAICNERFNFKNIGPYSNTIKPGEAQKNLYLGVLFDTLKKNILTDGKIIFSLIGGSTWQMMVDNSYDAPLSPKDEFIARASNYRVIKFKDALDVAGIIETLKALGYNERSNNV